MTKEFQNVLEGLVALVGETQEDLETDHGRWRLYERAIESLIGTDLLLRAVKLEVDKVLATSVVLRMLEIVADDQQTAWIDQLPPDNRAYSERRGSEIRILRRALARSLAIAEVSSDVNDWSDWLQLRLAGAIEDREGLAVLTVQGRTKRVRNAAAERLKALSG